MWDLFVECHQSTYIHVYIHKTVFSQFAISCSKIFITEIIGKDIILCLYALANFHEN